MTAPAAVEAAGGIVCRPREGGVEIALVHRPRYGDWTLPKGKVEPRETPLLAAVREVGEEIGADVAVTRRVGTVRYSVGDAPKRVTYWAMTYRSGTFRPGPEVSAVEWLPVGQAMDRLTYDVDRSVLSDFASMPEPDAVVVLVRHAKAGKRAEWSGPDDQRPLDANGVRQAERLARLLAVFAPDRVCSGVPVRCVETVRPLADALGLEVEVDAAFSDDSYELSPATTQTALLSLAKPGTRTVVASQGLTVPELVEQLAPSVTNADTKKGAFWVLSFVDGDVIAADPYPAP